MHNRHFIAIRPWGLLYGRVPKVANTSIKTLIAERLTFVASGDLSPTNDAYWNKCTAGETEMVGPGRAQKLAAEWFSFAFVRDPIDRALSCYANKFVRNSRGLGKAMEQAGFRKEMSVNEFAERLAEVGDDDLDVHLRSQAGMLCHRGKVVPAFIGRYETLDADWARLAATLAERRIVALPEKLPSWNRTPEAIKEASADGLSDGAATLLRRRYAEDYALFYKDAA